MSPLGSNAADDLEASCALCYNPDPKACGCENRALETALSQAQTHMMSTFFEDIRFWVRNHAKAYIETLFNTMKSRRLIHYHAHLTQLENEAAQYRTSPPASFVAAAHAELKRGIDEDWRSSVQKFPEVLEYYYSLVNFTLPNEAEAGVRDPPLSALAGARAAPGRVRVEPLREPERVVRVDGRGADDRHRDSRYHHHGRIQSPSYFSGMEGLNAPRIIMVDRGEVVETRQPRRSVSRTRTRSRHRSSSRRQRRPTRSRSRSRVRLVYESPWDQLQYR